MAILFLHPVYAEEISIRAARILDGKGGIVQNGAVIIRDTQILRIEKATEKPTYDLGDATILPGGTDTHVHISWHFDENGKSHDPESKAEAEHSLSYGLDNAYATLMGGVTTVQSVGSIVDQSLKDRLARGRIPGCRVITSLEPLDERVGGPSEMRAKVKELHAQGTDVIKIFASQSIRDGGGPTLTQEQLDAACGEAKSLGLRTVVHAHGPESARRAILAGCTSIEHGSLLDLPTLELMAKHRTYFDPHLHLIFRNYFENKEHFLGIGNYTEEGFAKMKEAAPKVLSVFQQALKVKGLKIVFGTDAVAGSHGRNFEELIYRVQQGGQDPMEAVRSATSIAAESLHMGKSIGSIAPGMTADLIAVSGNPLEDISRMRHVIFVMKGGTVVKYSP